METMRMFCNCCGGVGHYATWKTVSKDPDTNICTMQSEEVKCEQCNGEGYTEYAVFSVEEAKVILRHCGLNKE